jgi:hypothetical protein
MKSERNVRHSLSWFLRQRIVLLLVAAVLPIHLMPASLAAPLNIQASPTTLVSDADRMISYRHQEHMWQTSDGATHVVINGGSLAGANSSLTLYSSFDSGKSWTAKLSLAQTNADSTSDGVLVNNDLSLAYSSSGGQILFSVAHYDSVQHSWSPVKTETVFQSGNSKAINPALTIDGLGTIWCAFPNRDNTSSNANIKLIQRTSDATGWQDTGLIFGPTDNVSLERSARPVALSNGVGMVYSVHQNTFWAYRLNGWPTTQPWIGKTLFTSTPPYDKDPYASHFSVAADSQKNLHLAMVDHGKVMYFHFINSTQTWNPVRTLTRDVKATYPQVSLALGNVTIFFNYGASARVLQSTDQGTSFALTDNLIHQKAPLGSNLDYTNPRIETPGVSLGSIPVFQQYVEGARQKIMYFLVPIWKPKSAMDNTDNTDSMDNSDSTDNPSNFEQAQ